MLAPLAPPQQLLVDVVDTELGSLSLACDRDGLLRFLRYDEAPCPGGERARDPFGASSAIRAYFRGDFAPMAALRVVPRGTPFQETVWRALCDIPAGTTESYGALAARIGR